MSVTQRNQHDCAACCIAETCGASYEAASAAIACSQYETPGVPAPYPSQIAAAVSVATDGAWAGVARPIRNGPARPGNLVLMAGLGAYPGWHCVVLGDDGTYWDPADGARRAYRPECAMYVVELARAARGGR